jgi:hypothetical protein
MHQNTHLEQLLLKRISMEIDTRWHFYRKLSQTQNDDTKFMIGNCMGLEGVAALYSGIRTYDIDTHRSPKPDLFPESTKTI